VGAGSAREEALPDTKPHPSAHRTLSVHIPHITPIPAQLGQVSLGLHRAHGAVFRHHVAQHCVDILGHAAGIAADIEMPALLQPLPHVGALLAQA